MTTKSNSNDELLGEWVEMPTASKSDAIVSKLRATIGTTIEVLMEVTGWQVHSVRGFLSGTVRKRLGLPLESEICMDGHPQS